MLKRTVTLTLRVFAVVSVVAVVGCATTATPQTVAADQRKENAEFREDQREDSAAFDRQQQDERSALRADQAKARVDVKMSNEQDQKNFAIEARERVAKLDARVVELRKLGKRVSPEIISARDAVLAHIELTDDTPMTHDAWMKDRDAVNAELAALSSSIDRAGS
jgi:hypothetical protein